MTANPGEPRDLPTTTSQDEDPIPSDTFAARLVLSRHFAGRLSIEQAATRAGINPEAWRRWEDGAQPRDKVESAQAIAAALRINFNWLLLGGPLTGPRGIPTKRAAGDNARYPAATVRPPDTRPIGRPGGAQPRPTGPTPRRPVRISGLQVA